MWKSESRNHGRPTVMRRAAESRDIVGAGLAGIEVAAELAFQGARGIILHDFVRGARVGVRRYKTSLEVLHSSGISGSAETQRNDPTRRGVLHK